LLLCSPARFGAPSTMSLAPRINWQCHWLTTTALCACAQSRSTRSRPWEARPLRPARSGLNGRSVQITRHSQQQRSVCVPTSLWRRHARFADEARKHLPYGGAPSILHGNCRIAQQCGKPPIDCSSGLFPVGGRSMLIWRASSALPHEGISPRVVGSALHWCALVSLADGDRDRFDQLHRQAKDVHANGYPAGAYVMTPAWDSVVCTLEGRFDQAIALCQLAVKRGVEVNRQVLSLMQASSMMRLPMTYLGHSERYVEVVRAFSAAAAPPPDDAALMLALALTQLGRIQEARACAESVFRGNTDHSTIHNLILRLELAIAWQDKLAAAAFAEQLAPVAHLAMVAGGLPSIARLIGAAALVRGDVANRRVYFELSVQRCQQIRFRPELALSRLALAEVLLDHFPREKSQALEHLRAAAAEFELLRMQTRS
jgi:hypothetical protein